MAHEKSHVPPPRWGLPARLGVRDRAADRSHCAGGYAVKRADRFTLVAPRAPAQPTFSSFRQPVVWPPIMLAV